MRDESYNLEVMPIGRAVELLQEDFPEASHSSLRFLEREGLVVPERSPGGHRMYSLAAIERVRQIKTWQLQRLSLNEIRERLVTLDELDSPVQLSRRFLEHALAGNIRHARQVILDADDSGMPIATMLMQVLSPALWELGEQWEKGVVSVAQEKEVSEIVIDLLAELTHRHLGNGRGTRGNVVAACVAGEQHELALRFLITLLRAQNFEVHYLGSSVDPEFLADAVILRQPDVVLLSVTGDEHLDSLRAAGQVLNDMGIDARVMAGGQAVSRNKRLIQGWGIEAAEIGTVIEALEDVRDV